MRRVPVIALCLMALVLLQLPARAQFDNAGTSAAAFLKIGVGSRAVALGGAYTAIGGDPSSLYWNIAGIAVAVLGSALGAAAVWWKRRRLHRYLNEISQAERLHGAGTPELAAVIQAIDARSDRDEVQGRLTDAHHRIIERRMRKAMAGGVPP